MKTSQEHKREEINQILKKTLGHRRLITKPFSISCRELLSTNETSIDFSFLEEIEGKESKKVFKNCKGKGFVDCLFLSCRTYFSKDYPSVENLEFVDFLVQPIFSFNSSQLSSCSKTDVVLKIRAPDREISSFRKRSNSIISSAFSTVLGAFEYYANCHATFSTLTRTLDDATRRSRADIASECRYKMSFLTGVNRFV